MVNNLRSKTRFLQLPTEALGMDLMFFAVECASFDQNSLTEKVIIDTKFKLNFSDIEILFVIPPPLLNDTS